MRKAASGLLVVVVLSTVLVAYTADSTGYASRKREMTVVAVTSLPNGTYVGVSAKLSVQVVCPGGGGVYVETLPLSHIDL
ncbi:MAG: hypothetical protein NZ925_05270, partial [Sulfolobales archaeon]|nr:hypothetical protein [Sulfolobales archaeon]